MGVRVAELRALKSGTLKRDDGKLIEWLPDDGKRGAGTLLFRASGSVVRGYFRYAPATGKRDTLAIGQWDEQGKDGLTLVEIRAKADEWRKLYQSGVKDIRAHLEAEEQAREDERTSAQKAREEAERQRQHRERFTLKALCDAYVDLLAARGKPSHKHARSMFGHVPEDLALIPANEIKSEQVAAIVRRVREDGKDRAAGILRAYLRAAFSAAIRAPFDSELPADLIGFQVSFNPVDAVPAIKVQAGERTLSREELRAYMLALGDNISEQALKLALLAGGQRMAQLLRARVGDWDGSTNVLRLWDGKGKRDKAREHLLPLGPRASALVESLVIRAKERAEAGDVNPSLFLSVGGAVVSEATPGKRVVEIARQMGGEPFNLRDIRRSVETQMAGLRISRDVRAQLLSHGLSGVQVAHYDRHSYMDEKRSALLQWERHLEAIESGKPRQTVVRFKRAAA